MTDEGKENKGFKVTDKRSSYSEEDTEKKEEKQQARKEEPPSEPREEKKAQPPPSATEGEPGGRRAEKEGAYPPLDFTQFILSLASSAMLQLGEAPHPADGQYHTDVEGAKQTIDILGILEEKTRGNLNKEEENLLKNILADLRIRFVKKQSL